MAAPEKEQSGGEAPAPAGASQAGGGISTGLFLGVAGGVAVVMVAAGFAIAQFVLAPAIVKSMVAHTGPQTLEEKGVSHSEGEKKDESKKEAKEEKSKEGEGKKEEGKKEGAKEGKKEGGKEAAKEGEPKQFILSEMYVNIKGTRGTRLLKVSLCFEPPAAKEKLEENRAKIIDIVSQILSSKTLDQLTSDDIRGILREDIASKVNAILGNQMIQNIYFLDFVVQ